MENNRRIGLYFVQTAIKASFVVGRIICICVRNIHHCLHQGIVQDKTPDFCSQLVFELKKTAQGKTPDLLSACV